MDDHTFRPTGHAALTQPHLLLIGGGHAHVAVLADRIGQGLQSRATLLTPHPVLRYSGMVPGWIAGEHERDDGLVDLAALVERAGCDLVLDRCVGIDPDQRIAFTDKGQQICFDIASIDTGGVGRAVRVLGDDPRLIDVRPIERFVERIDRLARAGAAPERIAVIGGGAGGVELAFGLRGTTRFSLRPEVTLVAGENGLLPDMEAAVSKRLRKGLRRRGIVLVEADAALVAGALMAGGAALEPVDLIIAALGSAAPDWPRESGLACDSAGFVAVDRFQRSVSHPHIFAAGDVAARTDRQVPHSGVHAVHTGPILAENIRLSLSDERPEHSYTPRPASLYLLSTGDGGAIASYGPFSAQGQWVGRLKRWIDRRWIGKYAKAARKA